LRCSGVSDSSSFRRASSAALRWHGCIQSSVNHNHKRPVIIDPEIIGRQGLREFYVDR